MDDDDEVSEPEEAGTPAWVMTFADLMSLLMCFFVLLLSFAELDVLKFKQLAGSLKVAFGVQREVSAKEIPKGTSMIAQEFSAGKPDPTIAPEVKQKTVDVEKERLDILENESEDKSKGEGEKVAGQKEEQNEDTKVEDKIEQEKVLKELKEALKSEISSQQIEIETRNRKIIIRLAERGAFPPGLAEFQYDFYPVIDKLRISLNKIQGTITVAGHTDTGKITTDKFRSNWDLSAARAVSVAQALMEHSRLHPEQVLLEAKRFVVMGHAGTKPLGPNDTEKNRALNRRVEIIIEQDPDALNDADEANLPDDEGLEDDWINKEIFGEEDPKPSAEGTEGEAAAEDGFHGADGGEIDENDPFGLGDESAEGEEGDIGSADNGEIASE